MFAGGAVTFHVLAKTASEGDVQDLHAAAYAEHRETLTGSLPREGHFEGVTGACGIGEGALGFGAATVIGWVDVPAATQEQAIDFREDSFQGFAWMDPTHVSARFTDAVRV